MIVAYIKPGCVQRSFNFTTKTKDTSMPNSEPSQSSSMTEAADAGTLIAELEAYLQQQAEPRSAVMDEHAAAEYIGCSVYWLRNNRKSSVTPPFCKVGKNVRYRIESLDEWLKQQEVKN